MEIVRLNWSWNWRCCFERVTRFIHLNYRPGIGGRSCSWIESNMMWTLSLSWLGCIHRYPVAYRIGYRQSWIGRGGATAIWSSPDLILGVQRPCGDTSKLLGIGRQTRGFATSTHCGGVGIGEGRHRSNFVICVPPSWYFMKFHSLLRVRKMITMMIVAIPSMHQKIEGVRKFRLKNCRSLNCCNFVKIDVIAVYPGSF